MKSKLDALHKQGIHPNISLGQNFILDDSLLDSLAQAAGADSACDILEIGAGLGTFTRALSLRSRRVLAIEIDRHLLPMLGQTLSDRDNVTIIHGDALQLDLASLCREHLGSPLRVAANLPYYITTNLLQRLLHCGAGFKSVAVMVQREVGEKMLAKPGEAGYGPLSVHCQYLALVERALDVPAECFTPRPKVDSVFMRLTPYTPNPFGCQDEALLWRAVSAAFAMRRKTLANNLQNAFPLSREQALQILDSCGFLGTIRGEALDTLAFVQLANAIRQKIN